jgi:hypothetical protein
MFANVRSTARGSASSEPALAKTDHLDCIPVQHVPMMHIRRAVGQRILRLTGAA